MIHTHTTQEEMNDNEYKMMINYDLITKGCVTCCFIDTRRPTLYL